MNENQTFKQGIRGYLICLVIVILAIFAMAISTNYNYTNHPSCQGMLGAGFPKLFICDDWGGGSPTSSWERIDYVDVLNGGIRPEGFLVDFLFYVILIWGALFVVSRTLYKKISDRDWWWITFIILGVVLGSLLVSIAFQSSRLYAGDIRVPPATSIPTNPASITPIPPSYPYP